MLLSPLVLALAVFPAVFASIIKLFSIFASFVWKVLFSVFWSTLTVLSEPAPFPEFLSVVSPDPHSIHPPAAAIYSGDIIMSPTKLPKILTTV